MATGENCWFIKVFFSLVLFVCLSGCSTGGADLRAKYDICFLEDYPGATDRVVAFVPVRCSDKSIVLGAPIDGERATLDFADEDGDGVSEIIVASSKFWCRWGFESCIGPTRTVVKVSGERAAPVFTVLRAEKLEPAAEFK
jgi:hypothetical protein